MPGRSSASGALPRQWPVNRYCRLRQWEWQWTRTSTRSHGNNSWCRSVGCAKPSGRTGTPAGRTCAGITPICGRKIDYLKRNWLTVLALLVPALRVFRVFRAVRVLRAARAVRGLRLVRVLTSLNRGMKALGATMSRRGFGYVVVLTVLVTLVGAAGMLAFEGPFLGDPDGWSSYGSAVWWTAMIVTTLGSDYWPQTAAGRTLCFILALYGFAIFGYVTATLATFFIGRDAQDENAELASAKAISQLHREIAALREEIHVLAGRRPQ